jgi:WD40 repeat protein
MYGLELRRDTDRAAERVSPDVDTRLGELGVYVIDAAFGPRAAALSLGDGTVRLFAPGDATASAVVPGDSENSLPLCVARGIGAYEFVAGYQGGEVAGIGADGGKVALGQMPQDWIGDIRSHRDAGAVAVGSGTMLLVLDQAGAEIASFGPHDGTISALAFSPDGRRIAAAHYDQVTIWPVSAGAAARPQRLRWKGYHTGVAWSGCGRFLVTATQDKEIHCWDLAFNRDMRMSGYVSKIRSMAWTRDSGYLVVAGADTVTSWSFAGGAPEGTPPREFGYVFDGVVTQVATHPDIGVAAAGYSEGTVLIGDIAVGDAIIAKGPGGGPVTALAWSPDGRHLIAGTASGTVAAIAITGKIGGKRDGGFEVFEGSLSGSRALPAG